MKSLSHKSKKNFYYGTEVVHSIILPGILKTFTWKQPIPKGESVKLEFVDSKTGAATKISIPWSKYDLKSEYPEETSCGDALTHDKDYKSYKLTYVGINYCIYQSSLKNTLLFVFFIQLLPERKISPKTIVTNFSGAQERSFNESSLNGL